MPSPSSPKPSVVLDKDFHYWIGQCITMWAEVETVLFQHCWYCLGTSKDRAAIVYYRTPTLDARLSLTDELVKIAYPKPPKKDGGHPHEDVKHWSKMVGDIRDHLAIRRRIAHQPVGGGAPQQHESVLGGAYLYIPLEIYISPEEQLRSGNTPKRLSTDDLRTHFIEMNATGVYLKVFLQGKLIPQLGSRLPPDAPPQKGSATKRGR